MMWRRRSGFTIIELLMVLTIVGILSSVAVPKFRDVRRRASAAQLMGDFDVFRQATISFNLDSGYYPPDLSSGQVPPSLTKYLPQSFVMTKTSWTMDYDNLPLSMGPPSPNAPRLISLSFTTDPPLGQTALRLISNASSYGVGSRFTFVIAP